jgi:hypothetical protein
VVVVGGTVVLVVVVVFGAVVVVVVAGTAAGALGGHEDCAPARTSLVVSTIAPTAKARTMTAAVPRRRRRTIHTRETPAPMRRSANITNVETLAPVTGREQSIMRPYALKSRQCWIVTGRAICHHLAATRVTSPAVRSPTALPQPVKPSR